MLGFFLENTTKHPIQERFVWLTIISPLEGERYFVEVDLQFETYPGSLGWAGIVFRFQDDRNYELISLYWDVLYLGICEEPISGGSVPTCDLVFLEYWTFIDGEWTLVDDQSFEGDLFAVHHLTADIDGANLSFFLDDQFVFAATDTTGLTGGGIGLYTEDARASFDNWQYTEVPEILEIEMIVDFLLSLNLPIGTTNNLVQNLDGASAILTDQSPNNDVAAVNKLRAFINSVQAQAGKQIDTEAASVLIQQAQAVIDELSEPA